MRQSGSVLSWIARRIRQRLVEYQRRQGTFARRLS
jgi:hypothetical protein